MSEEEIKNESSESHAGPSDIGDIRVVAEEEYDDASRSKLKKAREELRSCEKEKMEYLEGWQRARADHINYKKDEAKRLEDIARYLVENILNDLLPVLDSFDLADQNLHADGDAGSPPDRGILLIRNQFIDILKKRGLSPLAVVPGEEFNPEKHESMGEVKSEHAQGKIAEVIQRGYAFRDRVLRPARVKIAK